ncbi:hypothetical protein TNCV_2312831 [Trichonephila clavipes]|nr:hypothetical protein TNCV_2312831 [Trichonephila clavipes]
MRSYLEAMSHDTMFVDDNTRIHRARFVNQYVERETRLRMEWPSAFARLEPNRACLGLAGEMSICSV